MKKHVQSEWQQLVIGFIIAGNFVECVNSKFSLKYEHNYIKSQKMRLTKYVYTTLIEKYPNIYSVWIEISCVSNTFGYITSISTLIWQPFEVMAKSSDDKILIKFIDECEANVCSVRSRYDINSVLIMSGKMYLKLPSVWMSSFIDSDGVGCKIHNFNYDVKMCFYYIPNI